MRWMALVGTLGLLAGCWADFPDSRFNQDSSSPLPDTINVDLPPQLPDLTSPDGTPPDLGPPTDGTPPDQSPPPDGTTAPDTTPVDLAGGDVACVDQDKDNVTTCDGDCNDGDADVFPGQNKFFDQPSNGSFDYNCDNTVETEHPDLVSCQQVPGGCTGSGWQGQVPVCGAQGTFATCKKQGNTCVEDPQPMKQGCR